MKFIGGKLKFKTNKNSVKPKLKGPKKPFSFKRRPNIDKEKNE